MLINACISAIRWVCAIFPTTKIQGKNVNNSNSCFFSFDFTSKEELQLVLCDKQNKQNNSGFSIDFFKFIFLFPFKVIKNA